MSNWKPRLPQRGQPNTLTPAPEGSSFPRRPDRPLTLSLRKSVNRPASEVKAEEATIQARAEEDRAWNLAAGSWREAPGSVQGLREQEALALLNLLARDGRLETARRLSQEASRHGRAQVLAQKAQGLPAAKESKNPLVGDYDSLRKGTPRRPSGKVRGAFPLPSTPSGPCVVVFTTREAPTVKPPGMSRDEISARVRKAAGIAGDDG